MASVRCRITHPNILLLTSKIKIGWLVLVVKGGAGHPTRGTVAEMVIFEAVIGQVMTDLRRLRGRQQVRGARQMRRQVRRQAGRWMVDKATGDDGRLVATVVNSPALPEVCLAALVTRI